MTEEILKWLDAIVKPLTTRITTVAEIGALNVNGSARDILQLPTMVWTGLDRQEGPCVDVVCNAAEWLGERKGQFELLISCEAYEHDPRFWETNLAARNAISPGGLYVITPPTIGFPFHDYGGDYYRFTEMTYREIFFEQWGPCDLASVGQYPHECIVGVARKPVST